MASAVVLGRIRSLAPEFASLSDSDLSARADGAGPYLSPAVYSNTRTTGETVGGTPVTIYDEAVALWSCHSLTRLPVAAYDSSGAGSGSPLPVTSDTTGGLSQSYTLPQGVMLSAADLDYMTTRYGLRLLALRSTRARAVVPLVV